MRTQFGGEGTLQRSSHRKVVALAKRKKVKAVLWGKGPLKKPFHFRKKGLHFTGAEGELGSIVCGQKREEGRDIERKKVESV